VSTRVILADTSGRWAAVLRAELDSGGLPLHEAGTLEAAWRELKQSPAAFLVIAISPKNLRRAIDVLRRLPEVYPRARAAVVAPRAMRDYRWMMAEAGAVAFTASPRQVAPLAEAAGRHLADAAEREPAVAPHDRIWQSLPWDG